MLARNSSPAHCRGLDGAIAMTNRVVDTLFRAFQTSGSWQHPLCPTSAGRGNTMRSRLIKTLVAATVATFALVTSFGASAALADDPLPYIDNFDLPTVSALPTVGQTATAGNGTWDTYIYVDGAWVMASYIDSYSYQWFTVNSTNDYAVISGAEASTLVVPPYAYTAGRIAVEVTAHLAGYEHDYAMSIPVSVQPD